MSRNPILHQQKEGKAKLQFFFLFTCQNINSAMQPEENANADVRQSIEDQLNDLLQKLFELSVIVYDFQPDGNKLVWKKV